MFRTLNWSMLKRNTLIIDLMIGSLNHLGIIFHVHSSHTELKKKAPGLTGPAQLSHAQSSPTSVNDEHFQRSFFVLWKFF